MLLINTINFLCGQSHVVFVEEKFPLAFRVYQPYPNPFNPTTTIGYSVPQDTHITLSIYNGSGQLVSVLKDEYQQAGNHTVTWNATGLPSGLYFYILKADGFMETRKMSLVK